MNTHGGAGWVRQVGLEIHFRLVEWCLKMYYNNRGGLCSCKQHLMSPLWWTVDHFLNCLPLQKCSGAGMMSSEQSLCINVDICPPETTKQTLHSFYCLCTTCQVNSEHISKSLKRWLLCFCSRRFTNMTVSMLNTLSAATLFRLWEHLSRDDELYRWVSKLFISWMCLN